MDIMAQTEAGTIFIGGTTISGISYRNDTFEVDFNPNLGYFIRDDLVLGISTPTMFVANKNIKTNIAIFPYARYYFKQKEKIYYFIIAYVGSTISYSDVTDVVEYNATNVGGGIGIAYFLTQSLSLESSIIYNSNSLSNTSSPNQAGISLNFGVNFYLNKM